MKASPEGDEDSCAAIISSIEKRWANADQGPFIAAVILNPLLRTAPFYSHPSFSLANIHLLMRSLFTRFFPNDPSPWLFDSLSDYLEMRGEFLSMEDIINQAKRVPEVGVCHKSRYHTHVEQGTNADNPLIIWKSMTTLGAIPSPLAQLALHIFSIHANSTSCEWLFSLFGNIQTKKRNQMTSTTLQMIAEIKMHLRDSHAASWNLKQQSHTKRQFGPPPNVHNQEPSQPATPISTSSSMPPPPTSERDVETENDLQPIGFREMIKDFNSLEAENADDIGDVSTYAWASQTVCSLFDFTSSHWVKEHRRKCSRGLDEELNFYELLSNHDVDAAGVEESQFCDYR